MTKGRQTSGNIFYLPLPMKKLKKLIINADGFGFTHGINRAIFEVAEAGNISSMSVNTNFSAVSELPAFHKQFPHISIGVHVNPVVGRPVLPPTIISSLLRTDGEFWGDRFPAQLQKGYINLNELFQELLAQVQVVLDMGIPVTHLDSHQNQHLRPGFFPVFLKVAKTTGIKRMRTHRHFICAEHNSPRIHAARYYATHMKTLILHLYTRYLMNRAERAGMRMADRLLSVGHSTGTKKDNLKVWESMLSNLPSGINEVYCHPAYVDDTLRQYAKYYVVERRKERDVLVSPRFRQLLYKNDVDLISFHDI
ncbi:MAG: ChbG/HpnK family deacetylase [Planctomycetia bacterium]|nr:ChbG/HpnK family deacetylase [Planctomycetia bacterium]GJQ22982.1 MAG: chitooligosaccharide deacetylase [Candidatus Brocadia sapporoensis]